MRPDILTAGGSYFSFLDPAENELLITDIAHALSNICRFTGHVRIFYSVAQHSVAVSHLVPAEYAMEGLLHDAAEAYIGDVSSPLKQLLPEYKAIEHDVERAIFSRYGLPDRLHPSVKHADLVMLATERRDLLPLAPGDWSLLDGIDPHPEPIIPLPPAEAKMLFMARWMELSGARC